MNEYWEDDNAYDSVAEELKEALRTSVKDEITDQIEKLTAENRHLRDKLKGLDGLVREAEQSKAKYDREFSTAKYEGKQAARKEKLADLLTAIDERLYTVERKYTKREKCNLCDPERRLHYTTPSGRETYEPCACAGQDWHWEPAEVAAHEVSSQNGKLHLWWAAVSKWHDSDVLNPRWLKRAEGAPPEKLAEQPSDYSFPDLAAAQATADAANLAKGIQQSAAEGDAF